MQFVVQLGDIIDARAKAHKGSDVECSKVLEELQKSDCQYLVNIIGNHELYNFNREELVKRLGVLKDGSSWYSFKPWEDLPLRMVVLDGYDISTIQGLDENKTSEAKTLLKRHNPNDIESFGVEWSKGLQGVNKRFMPYNGMIGDEQMHWFKKTLKESCESNEAVIILSHIPIHPDAADHLCLLWNYNDVLEVIRGHPCTVAVLAGHDHEVRLASVTFMILIKIPFSSSQGGHFLDNGVHHLTLPSPLLCQGDEVAFMTASVNAEHKELNLLWHGDSKIIPKDLKIKL